MTDKADMKSVLDAYDEHTEALNMRIIGDVVGTAQAIGEMRAALDKIDRHLNERKFRQALEV